MVLNTSFNENEPVVCKPQEALDCFLREDVLPALDLTQKGFADRLGVSRLTVAEVLLEKRSVTPDMAIRLGKFLGNGPEIWRRMQQTVDVWTLERRGECGRDGEPAPAGG